MLDYLSVLLGANCYFLAATGLVATLVLLLLLFSLVAVYCFCYEPCLSPCLITSDSGTGIRNCYFIFYASISSPDAMRGKMLRISRFCFLCADDEEIIGVLFKLVMLKARWFC